MDSAGTTNTTIIYMILYILYYPLRSIELHVYCVRVCVRLQSVVRYACTTNLSSFQYVKQDKPMTSAWKKKNKRDGQIWFFHPVFFSFSLALHNTPIYKHIISLCTRSMCPAQLIVSERSPPSSRSLIYVFRGKSTSVVAANTRNS